MSEELKWTDNLPYAQHGGEALQWSSKTWNTFIDNLAYLNLAYLKRELDSAKAENDELRKRVDALEGGGR